MGRSVRSIVLAGVCLWVAPGSLCWGEEPLRLIGHRHVVCAVAVSPDGKSVFTGSEDGTVRLWDRKSGKEMRRLAVRRFCEASLNRCAALTGNV